MVRNLFLIMAFSLTSSIAVGKTIYCESTDDELTLIENHGEYVLRIIEHNYHQDTLAHQFGFPIDGAYYATELRFDANCASSEKHPLLVRCSLPRPKDKRITVTNLDHGVEHSLESHQINLESRRVTKEYLWSDQVVKKEDVLEITFLSFGPTHPWPGGVKRTFDMEFAFCKSQ